MSDKAIGADLNKFTYERVTLNSGAITDLYTFLYFTEASHHAVFAYLTPVDIHEIPDFGSFANLTVIDDLQGIFSGFHILVLVLFFLLENWHFSSPFLAVWNDNRIPNILHSTLEEKLAKKYTKFLHYSSH